MRLGETAAGVADCGQDLTLHDAAERVAGQAETLADEMERGVIADRGGPEALRLLAAVVRLGGQFGPAALGRG